MNEDKFYFVVNDFIVHITSLRVERKLENGDIRIIEEGTTEDVRHIEQEV